MQNSMNNPFDVCFNILKIQYRILNNAFNELKTINPNDTVNVFINLESVLNNLSGIYDLDKKIAVESEFDVIIVSNLINLAAHYKRFFRDNNLPTNIYLYMTDLQSVNFYERELNDEYRSHYIHKYNNNPKYADMTKHMIHHILPDFSKICEFLPNVHVIVSHNIDGGMIPHIISERNKSHKNVIISNDIYDTQYSFLPNFTMFYIKRTQSYNAIAWNMKGYLKEILRKEPDALECIVSYTLYTTMLSMLGDKSRSIESIRRMGALTIMKHYMKQIQDNSEVNTYRSITMITELFQDDIRDEVTNNYNQYSIEVKQYQISDKNIYQIEKQIIDRFDNNSLEELQRTKFYHYPIMLEEITK